MTATLEFTAEEIERSRRYHRPGYWATALDLALSFAVLALLSFGPLADRLYGGLDGLPWAATAAALAAAVALVSFLVGLPISFWRGFVHERRWGFSTQSVGGWAADRVKGLGIGLVLTSGALTGFVGLARWLPRAWPLAAATAAGLLVLVMSFVAPVVLEPIFNRFRPLDDQTVVDELLGLSVRAGVPVREILVADASRRTRKENAYVSGLGRTRRVVVFDTLLRRADPAEIRLVVAHELGHRRMRHVAAGTGLAVAGVVVTVAVLWGLFEWPAVLSALGAGGPGDPRVIPFVLLAVSALELLGSPFGSALSRRWEAAADRFSLELTSEPDSFIRAHRALAISNLADLYPPRLMYLAFFSHPTPPERIALADTVPSGAATAGPPDASQSLNG